MKILMFSICFAFLLGCQSTPIQVRELPKLDILFNQAPIVRVEPKYPRIAAKNNTNGWVHLKFDIDELGKPKNIKILDVSPKGFKFEVEARRALRKWRYNTGMSDSEVLLEFYIR